MIETKSWFFGKTDKTDKPLARFIKEKREWAQINKMKMKERNLKLTVRNNKGSWDTTNKLDKIEEMDKS